MREQLGAIFAHVCLTYRKTVLLCILAFTLFTATLAGRVAFDNDMGVWFLQSDPAMIAYNDLLDTFGSDEYIFIGLDAPDVFAPEVLESIDRVTRAVEGAPHIDKVVSLTNAEAIDGNDGMLDVGELFDFPLDAAELPGIRERVLSNTLYVGNIVSANGTYAGIVARLPSTSGNFHWKVEAVEAVREIIEQEPNFNYVQVGGTVIDERFDSYSRADSARSGMLMGSFLIVALFVLLRTVMGVVVPLSTVVIALLWTVGLMGVGGRDANIITTLMPPLILAVGVADSMHIMVEYYIRCRAGRTREEALRDVYRELTWPCTLTSLTTSIGMLSLQVSQLQGMREFSLFSAIGVFSAFLLSITLVPIALSYLPPPKTREVQSTAQQHRRLAGLYEFTVRWEKQIVLGAALILIVGLVGASRVKTESMFLEYFKDGEPVKTHTLAFQDRMAGSLVMQVMIDTGSDGGVQDPEMLQWIEQLQGALVSHENITSSQSLADYFKDMRRAFFDGDQAAYILPESSEEAAQYLLLYEMSEPEGDILDYVTFDYRETLVTARLLMEGSAEANQTVLDAETWIDQNPPPTGTTQIAGLTLLYTRMEEYIKQSLIRGFSVALVAIFVIMCIQMRSVLLGLIAMLPNILPISIGLGVMGYLGIQLDSVTTMVASISIGIAVDDTVHFVSRVRQQLDQGASMATAVERAVVDVGRALIYTSVVLFAGFGVMFTNTLQPMINFGMLCTITIISALAADLLLLPILLRWTHRKEPVSVPDLAEAEPASA